MPRPIVRILDRSTVLKPGEVSRWRDAIQQYLDLYIEPVWGTSLELLLEREGLPSVADWQFLFIDNADEAGALGYHDLTADGKPLAKIFCETTLQAKESVSNCASHEAAELAVDPWCSFCADGPVDSRRPGGARQFYALELCDAVQERSFEIDGVEMSDFLHPTWFDETRREGSAVFSHLGSVTRPYQIDVGGYSSVFRNGRWTEIFGSVRARKRRKKRPHSRNDYYADPSPWIPSHSKTRLHRGT